MFALNRRDGAREIAVGGAIWFLPRGNLLAWIDTIFEPSTTGGQQTHGRMENVDSYYGCDPENPELTCVRSQRCPQSDLTTGRPTIEGHSPPPTLEFRERKFKENTALPFPPNRVHMDEAVRKVREDTAPETHGDFTKPRCLGQILSRVDEISFASTDFCRARLNEFSPKPSSNRQERICGVPIGGKH